MPLVGLTSGAARGMLIPGRTVMPGRMRNSERQLPLNFDEGPRWDACLLEAALAEGAGRFVSLTLTDNRSVLISCRRTPGRLSLRLHQMFLHAPVAVVDALGRSLRRRTRETVRVVRRFMDENRHRVRNAPHRMPVIQSQGSNHDLGSIFDRLNARFFDGAMRLPITWGRGGGRARRRGLTFGSYDPRLPLIRIHPVLDRRDVPAYFLESVVFHEMLHHKLGGVRDRRGRTVYHSRSFREAEAAFPSHPQALAWERSNLSRLLRASAALDRSRRETAARRKAS
jgi:hypothetical protein